MRRNCLFINLIITSLSQTVLANENLKISTQLRTQTLCERVLALDSSLLVGAEKKDKLVKQVFKSSFPEQNREFLVFRFQKKGWVPRPINFHKVKLRFVLIDTEKNSVVWQFEDYSTHLPTAFSLSPKNPDVGFLVKKVERLYLQEEAPTHAIRRHDLPGDLSSDLVSEVLEIYNDLSGQLKWKDIYTSGVSSPDIKSLRFDSQGNLDFSSLP